MNICILHKYVHSSLSSTTLSFIHIDICTESCTLTILYSACAATAVLYLHSSWRSTHTHLTGSHARAGDLLVYTIGTGSIHIYCLRIDFIFFLLLHIKNASPLTRFTASHPRTFVPSWSMSRGEVRGEVLSSMQALPFVAKRSPEITKYLHITRGLSLSQWMRRYQQWKQVMSNTQYS